MRIDGLRSSLKWTGVCVCVIMIFPESWTRPNDIGLSDLPRYGSLSFDWILTGADVSTTVKHMTI